MDKKICETIFKKKLKKVIGKITMENKTLGSNLKKMKKKNLTNQPKKKKKPPLTTIAIKK
jgi:hypothetical protein